MSSIVVVGCSHSTAPRALLDSLSVAAGESAELLSAVRSGAREALVLSTCNRTELYAITGHAGSGEDFLLRILAARAGTTAAELSVHAFSFSGRDAVRHALSVASGLDSMVLGEDQILAQWKRALAAAREGGAMGPVLDRLGSSALASGKRVRARTGIGQHSVSIESLAVRAASDAIGGLSSRPILVIGAGESAALVIRHLRASGAGAIAVMGRTPERAEKLARESGARATGIAELVDEMARPDAVFCCTSAPHPVVGAAHFAERDRPIVCVDLGMPRDVDDSVRQLAHVRVIPLEALSSLADAHRAARRAHVPAAEALVASEVARFLAWYAGRGISASVARLRAHAERVAAEELAATLHRLPALDARHKEIVARLARRIVQRLMHAPTVRLKDHPEAENLALALEVAFAPDGAGAALHEQLPTPSRERERPAPSLMEDIA